MNAKGVKDVKEVTDAAKKNIKDGMETVDDVKGVFQTGTPIIGLSGKTYYIKPCGFDEIPKLIKHIKIIDGQMGKGDASVLEILADKEGKLLKSMKEVIRMGLGDISMDIIGKEFSLGKFPFFYKTVLDLNDFLHGMRTLYQ